MRKMKVLSMLLVILLIATQLLPIPYISDVQLVSNAKALFSEDTDGVTTPGAVTTTTDSAVTTDDTTTAGSITLATTDSAIDTSPGAVTVTSSSIQIQVIPVAPDDPGILQKTSGSALNYLPKDQDLRNKKDKKTDRYIIKYKNDNGRETFENAFKGKFKKVKSVRNVKGGNRNNYDIVSLDSATGLNGFLAELKNKKADKNIEYIQPDYIITQAPAAQAEDTGMPAEAKGNINRNNTNDKDKNKTSGSVTRKSGINWFPLMKWGSGTNTGTGNSKVVFDIQMQPAWRVSHGEGIIVAVIDTGVDTTHEDITSNIYANGKEIAGNGIDDDGNGFVDDVNGWNFFDDNNIMHNPDNAGDEAHGTGIADIIAGLSNTRGADGVAPMAKVMPLKVFSEGIAYTSDIIEAIQYAEQNGAKIVNCSWGSTEYNQALEEAINASSMLFVCAAGNSTKNLDGNPVYPASCSSDNIIAAGSINENGQLSGFSNYGESTVDVAAPGNNVAVAAPGNTYVQSSGTSVSSAYVAGEGALVLGKFGGLTAPELRNRIISSSDRLSSLIGKIYRGNKINCFNAVSGTGSDEIIQVGERANDSGNPGDAANDVVPEVNSYVQTGSSYDLYGAGGTWTTMANMNSSRSCLAASAANGKIYVFGGFTGFSLLKTVEEYDPATNKWTSKANMSVAKGFAGAATVGGKIYVMGGAGNTSAYNTVAMYDPVTNTWTSKRPMPTAKVAFSTAVVNNKILAIGGTNENNDFLETVDEYDPANDSWSAKAPLPFTYSSPFMSAASIDGMVYITGCGPNFDTTYKYDSVLNSWTALPGMTVGLVASAAVAVNGRIYSIGGSNSGICSYVQEYDPATLKCVMKKSMPTARIQMAAVELNGEIYVIGGENNNGAKKTVEKFTPQTDIPPAPSNIDLNSGIDNITLTWDPATDASSYEIEIDGTTVDVGLVTKYTNLGLSSDTQHKYRIRSKNSVGTGNYSSMYYKCTKKANTDDWVSKQDMLLKDFGFGTATAAGKIFTLDGNSVYSYDPLTNNWSWVTNIPTFRYYLGTIELSGKIYAVGGTDNNSKNMGTVEVYDPSAGSWETKMAMPTSRSAFVLEAVNGKLYAIGGYNGTAYTNKVEEYNPQTNTWSTKTSMPTTRAYMASAVIDGKIYVMGGDYNNTILNTVEVYDPATDTWTAKAAMPTARNEFPAVAEGGMIYAIGGNTGSGYINTVEAYNPAANTWTTKSGMPTKREYSGAEAIGGKIYVMGGVNTYFGMLGTVEEYTPGADAESPAINPAGIYQPALTSASAGLKWEPASDNTSVASYDVYKRVLEPTGPNLITNGGFESGTAGWQLEMNHGVIAAFGTDNAEKFSGTKSARLDITATGDSLAINKIGIPIVQGKMYLVKFKAKATSPRNCTMYIAKSVSPWNWLGNFNTTNIDISEKWKSYSYVFTANETDLATARWGIAPYYKLGTLWLDDIEMYELTPSARTLISNVPSGTTFQASGLSADKCYEFAVKARDSQGNESQYAIMNTVTLPAGQQVMEAENMSLLSYNTEYNSCSSGYYSLNTSGTGQASFYYSGSSGRKNFTVWYYDETDGIASYKLFVNGIEKKTWIADKTFGESNRTRLSKTATSLSDITINNGDQIIIEGTANSGDNASIDSIEISNCDPGKPTAPQNLSVKSMTDTSVTLTWGASTDNDSITGYEIYNGTNIVGTVTPSALEYTLTGLTTNGAIHELFVLAKDADGNSSEKSNTLTISNIIIDNSDTGFTTDSPWTASTTAQGYYGSNYLNDNTVGADTSSRWAKWTPNIIKTGNYDVYMRWTSGENRPDAVPLEIAFNSGTDTSKTLNQLTNGSQWNLIGKYRFAAGTGGYIKIVATDAGYTVADAVKLVLAESADTIPPTAPSNLVSTSKTDTVINLSWTASADNVGVVGYEIYNGTQLMGATAGATTYSAIGLTPGAVYTLTVKAKDAQGNLSAASNMLSVTTNKSLADQFGLEAAVTGTSIIVKWKAVEGATGYDIEVDGVVRDNGSNTTFIHAGLTANTQHAYRVRFKNATVTSEWSNKVTCGLNKTNYIINCAAGREFIIMLDCKNISNFNDLIMTFNYNTSELEVLDLSSFTKARETTAGAISGTDVEIMELTPGQIKFKINKTITAGETWSGVANTVRIKCKGNGISRISYSIN